MRYLSFLVLLMAVVLGYLLIYDPEVNWQVKLMSPVFRISTYLLGMRKGAKFNVEFFENSLDLKIRASHEFESDGIRTDDILITHLDKAFGPISFSEERPWLPFRDRENQDSLLFPVPLRIYTPQTLKSPGIVIWIHGGGKALLHPWSISYDILSRKLVSDLGMVVFSIDYRLSPEYRFPAAPMDCYASVAWILNRGWENDQFEVLSSQTFPSRTNRSISDFHLLHRTNQTSTHIRDYLLKIFHQLDTTKTIIMGDSAGGQLGGVTTLMLIENQVKPLPIYQVLVYPSWNLKPTPNSEIEYADAYMFPRGVREWFKSCYLSEEDEFSRYINIFQAKNETLSQFPPTLIMTGGLDPFQDHGFYYTTFFNDLMKSPNYVQHFHLENAIHGFLSYNVHSLAMETIREGVTKILN